MDVKFTAAEIRVLREAIYQAQRRVEWHESDRKHLDSIYTKIQPGKVGAYLRRPNGAEKTDSGE